MSQEHQSLKQKIQEMAGDDDFDPADFSNLILDDHQISELTKEDKEYLNEFQNMQRLCMNHTGLKSLNNLPEKLKIQRVSIDWRLNN
jgi:hypothetical protein